MLGPTKDLAWRLGARTVIVSNSDASEKASTRALKQKAQSLSGPDTDFWIDHDRSLADAVLAAAEHRSNPLICLAVRPRSGLTLRRAVLDFAVARILIQASVPVMIVGPSADVTVGLATNELVASLDGSPESEQILPLAARWARELHAPLTLVGVSRTPAEQSRSERRYLDDRLALLPSGKDPTRSHLIEADEPGKAICAYLRERPGALMMMSTHGRSGVDEEPLGSVAQSVLLHASRPVIFRRPTAAQVEGPTGGDAPPPKREVWLNLPD